MREVVTTVAVVLITACAVTAAHAQGMVPARGAGDVGVIYQTGLIKDHLLAEQKVDVGHISWHSVAVDFTVGLGGRFALNAVVPFIAARYSGSFGHRPNEQELPLHPSFTFLDDGRYHGSWQDLRLELRYAASSWKGMHAMPFVAFTLPTHDYEYLAHAAVGRRVREARVGLGIHRLLTPWSGRTFVQAHVAHAFQERVAGISRRATHLSLDTGYFLNSRMSVFGNVMFHATHGGVDVFVSPRAELSGLLFINHDRIVRERMVNLGGGVAVSISDRHSIVGAVSRTVAGINGHAQSYVLTLGISRSFGSPSHGH